MWFCASTRWRCGALVIGPVCANASAEDGRGPSRAYRWQGILLEFIFSNKALSRQQRLQASAVFIDQS